MNKLNQLLVIIVACAIAYFCFEASIYLDGYVSLYVFEAAEFLFSPLIFLDVDNSTYASLVSAGISHTIGMAVLVLPVLYIFKKRSRLFIISYLVFLGIYILFELSAYTEKTGWLYAFALDRFIFQTVWLSLLLIFVDTGNKKRESNTE